MRVLKNPKLAQIAIEDIEGQEHVFSMRQITPKMWSDFDGLKLAIEQFVLIFGGDKEKYENNFSIQVIKNAVLWAIEQMAPQECEVKEKPDS